MTVEEIFNSTAVRSIEVQILSLYHETERHCWHDDENDEYGNDLDWEKCDYFD